MEFELRPFQVRDVRALQHLIAPRRSVLYQLPTGGGKTVTAGFIAQKARSNGLKVLILVHRTELIDQFVGTLRAAGLDHEVGVVSPNFPPTPWAPIQVAMVFSIVRRQKMLESFKPHLIIVDEAHHAVASSWDKVLAAYPEAKVLGLSATPRRLDGKGLHAHFEELHCGPSIAELVAWQYLAPTWIKRVAIDFSRAGVKKTAGDYNKKDLDAKATETVVAAGAKSYVRYAEGRPAIFFGVSVRHSMRTAETLREMGVAAEHVDGNTAPATRTKVMKAFRAREIMVVCNVDIISEGFDCPGCEVVVDAQPTASTTKYLQKVGRAMRYEPNKEALFLDLCGNVYFHGAPDEPREWSLADLPTAERQSQAKPKGGYMRCCAQCFTVFKPNLADCPHCGAAHDGRPVREVDVELLDLAPGESARKREARMNKVQRAQLAREAAILVKRGLPRDAWIILRDAGLEAGYHPRWAHMMADLRGIPQNERT